MCGRYVSATPPDRLAHQLAVDTVQLAGHDHTPRYNVAPTSDIYSVVEGAAGRTLRTMRWGFVPQWAKTVGGRGQPINARLETITSNRMFASSWRQRRCLVPADAYYEWMDPGDGTPKNPYAIADLDKTPLAFAAIWRTWSPDAASDIGPQPTTSTAIITTEARGNTALIHDRMPVILPATLWDTWLSAEADEAPYLHDAVLALDPPELTMTPISTRVNNVRNDGPELLEPVMA
ncbi:MAG: SOS response-associated peptidase [Nitriliruptoraceae bacterium]